MKKNQKMCDELLTLIAKSPFNSLDEVDDYMCWYTEKAKEKDFGFTQYDHDRYRKCIAICFQSRIDEERKIMDEVFIENKRSVNEF